MSPQTMNGGLGEYGGSIGKNVQFNGICPLIKIDD
jgi:hypothetical protein